MLGIQIAKQEYSLRRIVELSPALLISLNMALKLLKFFVLLVVLCVAAVITALLAINPNDYKPLIESKARESIGLTIKIDGDIGWSLLPLGFSVKGFGIYDQQGQLFTHVDSLQLAINTYSLLKLEPKIEGIYTSGANIVLTRNAEGASNWGNLIATRKPAESGASEPSSDAHSSSATPDNENSPLLFIPAQHIHLQDISIDYQDLLSGQEFAISDLNLEFSNVTTGKAFPLELGYGFSSDKLALNFAHQLSTQIEISHDLKTIHLMDLINNVDANGAFASNRAVKLSLTGDLEIKRDQTELLAHNIQISGAGLAIDTNFKVDGSKEYPEVLGNVSIAPFALSSIDRYLSLDLGVNNKAFQSVAFQTPFTLKNNLFTLPTFDLRVDQSQFIGRLAYHLANKNIDLSVKGDTLNLDNYLAAMPDSNTHLASTPSRHHSGSNSRTVVGAINSPGGTSQADSPILPLDTMRSVNAVITLSQDSFEYSDVLFEDLTLEARLTGNALELDSIDFKVFEGQLRSKGSILFKEVPEWQFNGKLRDIDLGFALEKQTTDLPVQPSGKLNGKYLLSASGNTVNALMTNNQGTVNLYIAEGVLGNINLDQFMCQGVAMINKDQLSAGWKADTEFKSLTINNALLNGNLNTTSLNIETGSLQAYGDGSFSLAAGDFHYKLSIKPKSYENESACRINERLADLEVPLNCKGSIKEHSNNAGCEIDSERMTEQVAHLASKEANRKIEKELDRGFEKELGKYIDKDSELGKQLKKSILGIFN